MHKIVPFCRHVICQPGCGINISARFEFLGGQFVPTWFHIPDEIAKYFLITNLSMNRHNQLRSTGAIPASLFADSIDNNLDLSEIGLKFDEMTNDSVLTVSVTNISKVPQFFTADVRGYYKEDLPPGMKYHHILGFGHTLVYPHASCKISVQPQLDCESKLLFVPPHLHDVFRVDSLSAGPNDHTSAADSNHLSGEAFCDVELKPDPIVPASTFFTLECRNRTDIQQWMNTAVLVLPVPPKETISK
jgi:hypothetical protein